MNKKSVTITDIAKRANVSKSTVSRVINNSTPVNPEKRDAVLAAMKELHFEPNIFARGLASGQSRTIGVMTQNIGSPFYDAISQGILTSLATTDYSPIFADGRWRAETGIAAAETLLGRMVDGLIVVGSRLPEDELDELKDRVPTLIVGREIDGWENLCLFLDNERAGYEATKLLIGLGHKQIVHISGIEDHQDAIRRKAGYRRALEEAGLPVDPELICDGEFDGDSGVNAIENLLNKGIKFTAVFAANDMTALGARLALYRRGIRVPEDVSIVGFDDQAESAFFTPPLTTVKQPANEMGVAAAVAMIKLIADEEYKLPNLESKVVVRESTMARD
ncbi:LacI family DNA-binding transcriptional regulator [Mariniblastus fucicola]|uniref:Catabolite control protein A n=1 Tax=Mariniblastus fucicola TaxID=980251 RepID=A0A5B9PD48_9BACT|nr:substrate-binding domain-containing protein [Mariniblastus fucicola]QEG20943.1 Catabolite control protein A [Mariniblastus fucicola]